MKDSKLRIAIIGMGPRGRATLQRFQYIENAQVVLLCDKVAQPDLEAEYPFCTDWHEVTAASDVHLIYICTPWDQHVNIAVEAMQQGKHVAIEVPAAMTVNECELLVRVAQWTERHCVMLENCCYDTWHLGIKEMVRQGMLGTITHLEGAYIHTLEDTWMQAQRHSHQGNPYPTHGFGPMCQLLQADDRPDYLISLSAPNPTTGDNLNDTLLRTKKGVTMLLQYDTSTPRPYNRLQTVCGTDGFAQKYPLPTLSCHGCQEATLTGDAAVAMVESFIAPEFKALIAEGKALGVPNVMNYMMDRRLIDGIQSGQPRLDMEVHEAALWSSITELTARSASQGGIQISIPDF